MTESTSDIRIVKPKPRCKKLKPRIDLAAMVRVSFLLIIFFMVNAELSKPQAMDLGLPDKTPGCGGYGGCSGWLRNERVITLLLDNDDKIICYRGLLEYPEDKPNKLDYGKDIRKSLLEMSKQILEQTGDKDKGPIVLIKPSKKSNYGNLVNILDEMIITKIPTYVIVNNFTEEESKLLASK